MNIKRSSKHFSMTMFSRCVLTLLILGLCQTAATASPSLRKYPGTVSVGNVKAAPSKKKVRSRANAQSDNGISGYMMCNNIDEDTYNQYGGVYLGQYHSWFWASPASKSFEADRTVLTYNTSDGEPYFSFRVEEGGAPLEAIKLARFACGFYCLLLGITSLPPSRRLGCRRSLVRMKRFADRAEGRPGSRNRVGHRRFADTSASLRPAMRC